MSSRSLGTLTLDVISRIGGFEQGMDKLERRSRKSSKQLEKDWADLSSAIGTSLTIFTAAAASAFAAIKLPANAIDQFNDLRDATGSSIENISALDRIARETGGSFETVEGVLIKFNAALKDADPKSNIAGALERIGLQAETLRRLDPAEALRLTAVALNGYAEDGDRARLVAELFGKSVKNAAAFLKDLSEEQKLVGTTTTSAADEVEKFNKELFQLEANATDAARALASDLIPKINELAGKFKQEGFFALFGFDKDLGAKQKLAGFASEVIAADKAFKGLQGRAGGPFNFAGQLDADLTAAAARLEQAKKAFKDAQASYFGLTDLQGGRGIVNPALARPSVGSRPPPPAKPGKDPLAEAKRFLESLERQLEKTQDLTVAEQALTDIQAGRLGKVSESLQKQILGTAEQIDAANAFTKSLEWQTAAREKNFAMALKADEAALAGVESMIGSNQALKDEIALIGLSTTARLAHEQALIADAVAAKELDLIGLRNADASVTQITSLEREIALLKERSVLLGRRQTVLDFEEETKKAGEFADELNKDLRSAFQDAFRATDNPIKAFGESIYTTVASRLSAALSESLADSLLEFVGLGGKKKTGGGGGYSELLGRLGMNQFGAGATTVMTETQLGDSFAKSFAMYDKDAGILSKIGSFFGLNFEGGGYTGDGPRSGGLDGKGGFMAMVHPQESIIDHAKGQGTGGPTYVFNGSHNRNELIAAVQTARALSGNDQAEARRRGRVR